MRYVLQADDREPIYHARTTAQMMLSDAMVEEQISAKSHAAFRTAYRNLPATAEVTELQNLMASIAQTELSVMNNSNDTLNSVVSRLTAIIDEARSILE